MIRRLLCLLFAVVSLARAHDAFEITATARINADSLDITVTTARATAMDIALGKPDSPSFAPEDFDQHRAKFVASAARMFRVTSGDQPLALRSAEVTLGPEDDVDYHLVFPRPTASPLRIDAIHISKLAYGYGAALTVQEKSGIVLSTKLLTATDTTLEVSLADTGQPPITPAKSQLFVSFLRLGIDHILSGYDHLLFLTGLLVACRRFRTMLGIITCFTLAHSITLALAALGIVVLSSRVVEPLIAASIVFVGVENLLRREEPPHRWLLTFAFGLIHGFGFADALREAGLGGGGAGLAVPLFSFNLGVEFGQLAVVVVLLPILLKLRERPAFARYGVPAISGIVVALGAWWLLERTLLA